MKTERKKKKMRRERLVWFYKSQKRKKNGGKKEKNHFCHILLIATEDFPFCFPLQLKEKSLNKKVAEKEILKDGLFQSF